MHYIVKLDSGQNCRRHINQLIEIDENSKISHENDFDFNHEGQYHSSETQPNDTASDTSINLKDRNNTNDNNLNLDLDNQNTDTSVSNNQTADDASVSNDQTADTSVSNEQTADMPSTVLRRSQRVRKPPTRLTY